MGGSTWSYDDFDGWSEVAEVCGTGMRQSPIDIDPATVDAEKPETLIFWNYEKSSKGTFKNNGHTMQFDPDNALAKGINTLSLGLWDDRKLYQLAQFHFHWGSNNSQGSEHTMSGSSYPLEMHLVHVNMKYDGNVTAALENEDGLAVVGIFFEVSENVKFKDRKFFKVSL